MLKVLIIDHMRFPPVTVRRWYRLPDLFSELGWEVLHLPRSRWGELVPRLISFRPRVVISAGVIGFIPALLKRMGLLPPFLVHDWLDDYAAGMGKKYGIGLITFLEKYTIRNSDQIISPSKRRTETAARQGLKSCYVPHGVEEDFAARPAKRLPGRLTVGYAGIINRRKRVDRLIEAVRDLDCELYLLGPYEELLRGSAPPNAHFMGMLPPGEAVSRMKGFDINALTMDNDSSLKMFEYIAARRPILALAGKISSALKPGEEAWVTDDLRSGLRRLLEDRELREKLARNLARRPVLTWKAAARRYMEAVKANIQ